jgi:hypothetical protein
MSFITTEDSPVTDRMSNTIPETKHCRREKEMVIQRELTVEIVIGDRPYRGERLLH